MYYSNISTILILKSAQSDYQESQINFVHRNEYWYCDTYTREQGVTKSLGSRRFHHNRCAGSKKEWGPQWLRGIQIPWDLHLAPSHLKELEVSPSLPLSLSRHPTSSPEPSPPVAAEARQRFDLTPFAPPPSLSLHQFWLLLKIWNWPPYPCSPSSPPPSPLPFRSCHRSRALFSLSISLQRPDLVLGTLDPDLELPPLSLCIRSRGLPFTAGCHSRRRSQGPYITAFRRRPLDPLSANLFMRLDLILSDSLYAEVKMFNFARFSLRFIGYFFLLFC